jgi:hypothetical protein
MTTEQRDTTEQEETAEQQESPELQEQAEHETKAKEADRSEEATGTGDDQGLFRDNELQSFRSRWDEVQGRFVDETRSGLEDQWNKGEDASTEDLRVALMRYRAFFQRLLQV